MFWIEKKYASLIGTSVRNFKQKSDNLWNFSCPICNDSQKQRNKARGYLFVKSGSILYHCHNCSVTMKFDNFLKEVNFNLYEQFVREKFNNEKVNPDGIPKPSKKLVIQGSNDNLKQLTKVSKLLPNHPCKLYVISRQIPTTYHHKLFYCPKFKTWTNSIIPDKFSSLENDNPRLVIPLIDNNGIMFAYQGRALNDSDSVKYITIMLDETKARLFGLDTVDFNYRYYIFEGPIDSIFIKNSIATCGGVLTREMDLLDKNTENAVVVYDNEPRSQDTVKKMLQAGRKGYKVCVWPEYIEQKDINAMILSKVGVKEFVRTELIERAAVKIQNTIDDNVFSGLEAELRITKWKKTS